jgi:hypothetical protein
MQLNRHPADRLADVRSEIKQLEAEEERLRAYLLEHLQDRTGQEYAAIVGSQSRRRVDLKALADEIGASVLAAMLFSFMILECAGRGSDMSALSSILRDVSEIITRYGAAIPRHAH